MACGVLGRDNFICNRKEETRMERNDRRMDSLDKRMDGLDQRMDRMEKRIGERFDRARQDRKEMEARLMEAIVGQRGGMEAM